MVADVWTMFWHEIGEEDETSADRLQTVEIVYESEFALVLLALAKCAPLRGTGDTARTGIKRVRHHTRTNPSRCPEALKKYPD